MVKRRPSGPDAVHGGRGISGAGRKTGIALEVAALGLLLILSSLPFPGYGGLDGAAGTKAVLLPLAPRSEGASVQSGGARGGVSSAASGNNWTNAFPSVPSRRSRAAMAYDSSSDRSVLFGGFGSNDVTWAYDYGSNTWTNLKPAVGPSWRYGGSMVYDSHADRMVLFGGETPSSKLDDTWTFDVRNNTWTDMRPSVHPSARTDFAMVYDSRSERVIIHGGEVVGSPYASDETWSYDYPNNTWTNRNPAARPSARYRHAASYDNASDRVIAYGGLDLGSLNLDETWSYDYANNTWTNQAPGTKPPARTWHRTAYDARSDRTLLFGGVVFPTWVAYNDTWAYDLRSNTWTRMDPVVAPSARFGHGMAYDSRSDRAVVFGGTEAVGDPGVGETWSYEPATNGWVNLTRIPLPPRDTAIAYDSLADRTVLFGRGTWIYDVALNTWANTNVTGGPPARSLAGMAYDSQSDRVILFGGGDNYPADTWAYALGNNTWTNMQPAVHPSGRVSFAMAYDAQSDRVVLFGGYTPTGRTDETWAYDFETNAWTNMRPATRPVARSSTSMAYDPRVDRVILFGGQFQFTPYVKDDTWAYDYDNNTWTDLKPSTKPAARWGHAVAYAAHLDQLVLFGGATWAGDPFDDTWAYDFARNTWTNLDPTTRPSARYGHLVTYDTESSRVILFGGSSGGDETWLYPSQVAPSAPRALEALPGDALVALSWQPPSSNGGLPLLGYRIYRGTTSGNLSPIADVGPVLAFTDTNVTNGTTEFYRVSAINEVGEGPRSDEAWATPGAPSAPLSLQAMAGNGRVNLSWAAPVSQPVPVTAYEVYRGTTSGRLVQYNRTGTARTFLDTNVTNGFRYFYQVSAINSYGEGPRSLEVEAAPVGPPTAPLALVGSPGDGTVDLRWQPPLSNGGFPITAYRLYRGTSSGNDSFLTAVATVLNYTDSGLQNAVTYYYQVSAVNAAGEGVRSAEAQAEPAGRTTAPRTLAATPGSQEVILSWEAPASDGGSPVTDYNVYRGSAPGGESLLVVVGNVTSYPDTGLTNDVAYYYVVSAVNAVGESLPSNEASATPRQLRVSVASDITFGSAPLVASFTSTVVGGLRPYTYTWSFGDGYTGAVANPSHTYLAAGTYNATLSVLDAQLTRENAQVLITVLARVVAVASADATIGPIPFTVAFHGTASGGVAPHTFQWDFGDTTGTTGPDVSHTYVAAGTYTVTLTVHDAQGRANSSLVSIRAVLPLAVDAAANPASGAVPFTVSFTANPSGGAAPFSFQWRFGDGGNTTLQNPSHVYSAAGTYAVTLTVTDASSQTTTKTLEVVATGGPGFAGLPPWALYPIIALAVGVGVAGGILWRRHRARRPPKAET